MGYNIKLTANKQRVQPDGLVVLRYYVSGNGEHDYIPTSVVWKLQDFDEKECIIKRGNADVKSYNNANQILTDLYNRICKILDNQTDFSISDLKDELKGKQIQVDFITYALKTAKNRLKRNEIQFPTYKAQVSSINILKGFTNKLPFSKINLDFLNNYKNYLINQGYERNTVWTKLKDFRTYLNLAKDEKILFEYPFGKKFKMPRIESRIEFLHENEFNKLKEHYLKDATGMDKVVLRAFLFSCYTSIRLSDILSLRGKNIKNNELEFYPQKTSNSETKKTLKLIIPLHEFAKTLISETGKEDKIFSDLPTEQKINLRLKGIAEKLNIQKNISFHYSRHTFATRFLASGGAIEILKDIMGHESIETTMIYVHVEPSRKANQIKMLT